MERQEGFREDDGIPCPPQPIDDMWRELTAIIAREATNPWIRSLLDRALERYGDRLRIWPAALLVHHAYRGGLLEHILMMAEVGVSLARQYQADANVVLAGAVLHDIGKLEELEYADITRYSTAGNLLGHITLGAQAVNTLIDEIEGFPEGLKIEVQHLVLSHHGSREFGSPVEPMTVEAFILAAVDDLDAKIHQARRHVAEDEGEGPFTGYHPRLKRVLLKPSGR